jgi:hypothetical protein
MITISPTRSPIMFCTSSPPSGYLAGQHTSILSGQAINTLYNPKAWTLPYHSKVLRREPRGPCYTKVAVQNNPLHFLAASQRITKLMSKTKPMIPASTPIIANASKNAIRTILLLGSQSSLALATASRYPTSLYIVGRATNANTNANSNEIKEPGP